MYCMKVEASKVRKDFPNYIRMAKARHRIIITRHGKPQAVLTSLPQDNKNYDDINDFVGMWADQKEDAVRTVNKMRNPRRF